MLQSIAVFFFSMTWLCQCSWICKVNKKFIVKEIAILKQGTVLTHYIFMSSVPWKFLRFNRSCASWLSAYHHGLREDPMRRNAWSLRQYLKIMLSYTSRNERKECDCGTCFWTMSENACTSRPWFQFTKTWNLSNLNVTNIILGIQLCFRRFPIDDFSGK